MDLMVYRVSYRFYFHRKMNYRPDSVLVLGMKINLLVYREEKPEKPKPQCSIVHYEQKKKEIIKNRGKLVF